MASVTSIDHDMRNLRMSRYTAAASKEARVWIETVVGERLPAGDLMEVLRDGTVLCKLANLVLPPPGIKFKRSSMPFMQMENIAHFLHACELPPLSLPSHDRFLTVDLYECKDPAQVIQCLGSFSRTANQLKPAVFPVTIGPKRGGALSPTATGGLGAYTVNKEPAGYGQKHSVTSVSVPPARPVNATLTGGSNSSRSQEGWPRSPLVGAGSGSARKADDGPTSPGWNTYQYGYMGGASQGNQGISFGAKRQITSPPPHVPSLMEKERSRKEARLEADEAERRKTAEREADMERARVKEENRALEAREKLEEEKRWQQAETKRRLQDAERRHVQAEAEKHRLDEAEMPPRIASSNGLQPLRGQFLSEYKKSEHSQAAASPATGKTETLHRSEAERIRELEKQLEEARERERHYLLEQQDDEGREASAAEQTPTTDESDLSWIAGDDDKNLARPGASSALVTPKPTPPKAVAARPLPTPVKAKPSPPAQPFPSRPLLTPADTRADSPAARPLPDPADYSHSPSATADAPRNRTDRFLSDNPAPVSAKPATHYPAELGLTAAAEQTGEDARRAASQQRTKAGGWASKSMLEREMERERERQREWEEAQKQIKAAPADRQQGSDEGVGQYGWRKGDSQNRPGPGIGFGGKRQIIGPRPGP